jgi:hypothetical protein
MKMKRTLVTLVVVAALVGSTVPATAADMVKVQIKNISKQIISPPVVATHTWRTQVFVPGRAASTELGLLAEDGNPSELAAMLEMDDEVLDVAIAGGLLFPGETVVLELEARGRFNRVSAVGMLVSTNDAFFGLENFQIEGGSGVQRTTAPAWDAGTEFNNELCAFIPGPPCGNPFVRDTTDAEGFIHIHSGIHGSGDLSSNDWQWQNPVVSIAVVK